MIQRIQSIFFGLGALCLSIFAFSSVIWSNQNVETGETILLGSINIIYSQNNVIISQISSIYILILSLLISIIFIVALLNYKNRVKQISISKIIAISLIVLILTILFFWDKSKNITELTNETSEFNWVFILPALAIFFNSLAVKAIKKDIALLKSSERIR